MEEVERKISFKLLSVYTSLSHLKVMIFLKVYLQFPWTQKLLPSHPDIQNSGTHTHTHTHTLGRSIDDPAVEALYLPMDIK